MGQPRHPAAPSEVAGLPRCGAAKGGSRQVAVNQAGRTSASHSHSSGMWGVEGDIDSIRITTTAQDPLAVHAPMAWPTVRMAAVSRYSCSLATARIL